MNLTAIIVSFYRTEYLKKCAESMRRQYPQIKIMIGNNGPESAEKEQIAKDCGAEYYQLPFDCGICVGRNRLIDKVQTKYALIGDDDFFYSGGARVENMLRICQTEEFDLIGGRICEGGQVRSYQGFIEEKQNHFVYKKLDLNQESGVWTDFGLVYPCDITFNYFVAKTETLKAVRWDEQIKVAYEHSSFFIDFKRAGYKTAFFPAAIVEHKPPIEIRDKEEYREYKKFRSRKSDKERFFKKYKLQYVIDMAGNIDFFDGLNLNKITFCITHFERKESLRALLFSIAKYYPFAQILIGDQGSSFLAEEYRQLWDELATAGLKNKPKAINLPFDCGLSFARNRLVELAKGEYILILEDDFEFTEETKIETLLSILERNPDIKIVGGDVRENNIPVRFNFFWNKKNGALEQVADGDNWREDREVKWKKTGSTMNFFLSYKKFLLDNKWDEKLKINSEHTDFFYRLDGVAVAFTPDCVIKHNKELDRGKLDEYRQYRDRKDFFKILFKKHKINKLKYLSGYTIAEKNGKIITGKNL